MKSELVTPAHLARRAVIYVRQSTPAQVVSNQESLRLQYALGQRARELGWHACDIYVIIAREERRPDALALVPHAPRARVVPVPGEMIIEGEIAPEYYEPIAGKPIMPVE